MTLQELAAALIIDLWAELDNLPHDIVGRFADFSIGSETEAKREVAYYTKSFRCKINPLLMSDRQWNKHYRRMARI